MTTYHAFHVTFASTAGGDEGYQNNAGHLACAFKIVFLFNVAPPSIDIPLGNTSFRAHKTTTNRMMIRAEKSVQTFDENAPHMGSAVRTPTADGRAAQKVVCEIAPREHYIDLLFSWRETDAFFKSMYHSRVPRT